MGMRGGVWRKPFNICASYLSWIFYTRNKFLTNNFVPCTFKCSPLALRCSLLMLEYCILLGKAVHNSVYLIDFAVEIFVGSQNQGRNRNLAIRGVVLYLQSEVNNPFSNFSRSRRLEIVRTNMKNNLCRRSAE